MTTDLFNPSGRFQPPQESECIKYALEIELPSIQASAFFDYQTSKGWRVGKSPMKDWKAAMRTWRRNAEQFAPKVSTSTPTVQDRIRGARVG